METSFKESLADHIQSIETFDFDTVQPDLGFKNIHWMVANSYLDERGYSLYQKVIKMESVVGMTKRSLYPAKEILEGRGIRVYFIIPNGTKLIKVITTDAEYKKASESDFQRVLSRTQYMIKSSQKQLLFRHPMLLENRRNLISSYKRLDTVIAAEIAE